MSMTDTPGAQKITAEKLIVGGIALLAVVAVLYVLSQRQQELRRSPIGLDGLHSWLVASEQSVQNFSGGWPINRDEVGLNILPIYDTNLTRDRTPPRTQEELLMQQDEYDVVLRHVQEKAENVTLLAVLPKWRTGMRLTGVAHPFLGAKPAHVDNVLSALIKDPTSRLRFGNTPFTEHDYLASDGTPLTAITYGSQMFVAPTCKPLIGSAEGMILGACKSAWNTEILILSDPDLLNNHGLRLGDNAFIIRDVVQRWAGDQQVLIDYSRRSWFVPPEEKVVRKRTWSDLLRFFEPPFTLMWLGLGFSALLVLWRAAMRFGPLRDSQHEMSASKQIAIRARAMLMRLSGEDGALVNEYARARLAATATTLFGAAHARQLSAPDAFLAFTKRRHPALAVPLAAALNTMAALSETADAHQAMVAATELERILERIIDDTGRTRRTR